MEKTVFISYRRVDRFAALLVFKDLTQHGFDVFIDYDGLASGDFERAILDNIRARAHFVLLLTPTALARCADPNDLLRREIEAAIEARRNVVPLLLPGFSYDDPDVAIRLSGTLTTLRRYHALNIPSEYFDEAMTRLRNKHLAVRVDAVLHPPSLFAQSVAVEQQQIAIAASAGPKDAHSDAALPVHGPTAARSSSQSRPDTNSGSTSSFRSATPLATSGETVGLTSNVPVSGQRAPSKPKYLRADSPTEIPHASPRLALLRARSSSLLGATAHALEGKSRWMVAAGLLITVAIGSGVALVSHGPKAPEPEAPVSDRPPVLTADMQAKLGDDFFYGQNGRERDYKQAADRYLRAAEQGNFYAQGSLAFLLEKGLGVAKDETKAREWYEKAAVGGDAIAQAGLGAMYERGTGGLLINLAEAQKWYRSASDQGHPPGMVNLGRMYESGIGGLSQDDAQAFKLYQRAAEQGYPPALAFLGDLYQRGGQGVARDTTKARELFKQAAAKGDEFAAAELKRLGVQ